MPDKPFSQACENNKRPILSRLQNIFADCSRVLEIGAGTGQHAAFLAPHLPHLNWQPSDVADNIAGIEAWCEQSSGLNLLPPAILDVRHDSLPAGPFDAVFTANTLHIMHWPWVERTFQLLAGLVAPCELCVYGPFNYHGKFTSPSNARFNDWLQARDPHSAIRDFEAVDRLAELAGFVIQQDHEMPANNRLLHWRKAR